MEICRKVGKQSINSVCKFQAKANGKEISQNMFTWAYL